MGGDRGGDRESGRAGWNPSEALPGVMGAATKAALAACSTMSDVTARALAGIFPRSIPMATLRTLAYLLWGFLFFAVFQRVISGFVLVGGLLLLTVAVAQGEMSLGNRGDPRDGRAWGAAFGSRGSNFDEFRDRRRKERRRKGAEDFFGRAAAAAGGAPMMEWWNERVEYERDFYSYPQNDEPEGNPRYDDGDVGASRQDKAESDEAHRRRSYDLDGDYVDVTPWEFGGALTIELLVRWDEFNQWAPLFDFGDGNKDDNVYLRSRNNQERLQASVCNLDACKWLTAANGDVQTDKWTHVVLAINGDSNDWWIYRDGGLLSGAGSRVQNLNTGVNPVLRHRRYHFLGQMSSGTGQRFEGTFAYMRTWHGRALTAEAVLALYESSRDELPTALAPDHEIDFRGCSDGASTTDTYDASVTATAVIVSPAVMPGNQRAFCSGVPAFSRCGEAISVCTSTVAENPPKVDRPTSSASITLDMTSSPAPPYCSS